MKQIQMCTVFQKWLKADYALSTEQSMPWPSHSNKNPFSSFSDSALGHYPVFLLCNQLQTSHTKITAVANTYCQNSPTETD